MKYIILEKSKQVQVKPYQRKGKMVLGYHRLDPRQKMTALEAFMGGAVPKKGWQKEAAEKFVSEMNPIFDKYGYKVEVTGSVSRGKVYKEGHWDLDLKLTHTKPDERATAEDVGEELTGDLGRLLKEFGKKGIEAEYHELSEDENEPSATLHLKDGRVIDLYEHDPYIEGELSVEPKLYHGTLATKIYPTREDVPEEYLDPGQASSLGIYLTDSPQMAETFGKKVFTAKPPKNTLDLTEAKTVDDYVDLLKIDKEKHGWAVRNLKVDSAFFDDPVQDSYRLLELLNWKFNIVDALKQRGYDSIKFKEEHFSKKGNTIVIFDPSKVEWVDVIKSYVILEKGKKIYVPGSIKQKAYWRYDPRTKMAKQVLHAESIYHAPSTLEKIVNNIKSLLEKIGLMKKKGLFTSEQRKYAHRRLKELEPKLKYFRTKKQRLVVSKALKEIRKELAEKVVHAERHKIVEREARIKKEATKEERGKFSKEITKGLGKLGFSNEEIGKMNHREAQVFYYKDISREMYLGLKKLGYGFLDIEKMSTHEAKATYWNEIAKESPKAESPKAESPKAEPPKAEPPGGAEHPDPKYLEALKKIGSKEEELSEEVKEAVERKRYRSTGRRVGKKSRSTIKRFK